ncbi:MAG: hypothetical protein ACOCUH_00335 [Bacteriovoracia bacterium]
MKDMGKGWKFFLFKGHYMRFLIITLSLLIFSWNIAAGEDLKPGAVFTTKNELIDAIVKQENWFPKNVLTFKADISEQNLNAKYVISKMACGRSQCKTYLIQYDKDARLIGVFNGRPIPLETKNNEMFNLKIIFHQGKWNPNEALSLFYTFNGQYYELVNEGIGE